MSNRSWTLPIAVLVAAGFYLATTMFPVQAAKEVSPTAAAELIKTDVKLGEGVQAISGKMVSVHYTGWLYDEAVPNHQGKKFDSSRDRNQPFPFALGKGQVIPGWDLGVEGMKIGGKRLLIIPPALAYGARGAGGVIPPNAKLVFEVELLGVQ